MDMIIVVKLDISNCFRPLNSSAERGSIGRRKKRNAYDIDGWTASPRLPFFAGK